MRDPIDESREAPSYFCPEGYAAIVERARGLGYVLTNFKDFVPPRERPVLLLRHDLDHSVRSAVTIAELEAEVGVSSTYFIQVACEFYNLLSRETRGFVRRIVDLKHEIGLHYESSRYVGEEGRKHLACDLSLLEDIGGQRVISAAQHIPIDGERVDLGDAIVNEAYEGRFTTAPMQYVSDSLMKWRRDTPHDLLARRASFQLLTHPMKWAHAGVGSMSEALAVALSEERRGLEMSYSRVEGYYNRLLRDREQLDRAFQQRVSR